MPFISVNNIKKSFKILKSQQGILNGYKSLLKRDYYIRQAINDISFQINQGEIVGYIGPNGAGKSTTIKIMCGILLPDDGSVKIDGLDPYRNRQANAMKMGVTFGQRSQLNWDLPVSDTFDLYKRLYEIPDSIYAKNRSMYIDLFNMSEFFEQPARELSLGQKMKANLALSMLHEPKVLYLDEPTIGLDVTTKKSLRMSIQTLNKEKGTTIILTTHDMNDVESVCNRIILIDKGSLAFDNTLHNFKSTYQSGLNIRLEFDAVPEWVDERDFQLVERTENMWLIKVQKGIGAKESLAKIIALYEPTNIMIQNDTIEEIVERLL